MGIIGGLILIIMCLIRMILINIPSLITLICVQAIVYWISGVSIYNKFIDFCLKEI